jgi:hypothetical protein
MSWVQSVFASAIFWGFVTLVLTLVLAAIAVSGKQSMNAASALVISALITAFVGLVLSDLARLPLIPRWLIVIAVMCVLGIGAYYLIQWLESKAIPNQAEIERPTPHLQAELIIDSVKAEAIPFHLRITNIGDLDVSDLKIHQNATVVRSTGPASPMLPVTNILPKRGHVSMQGVDPGGLAKVRQFYATLTFKCSIKGEVSDFLASYRFVLPDGTLTPQQVVDPRGFIETTGHLLTAEGLQDEAKTSISDRFATQAVGTIEFWTTEKIKTGEANYIRFENDTRSFVYDPVAHKIWLSSKPVNEALMMSFEPKDRHFVAFAWDESGPSLVSIDGKSKTR